MSRVISSINEVSTLPYGYNNHVVFSARWHSMEMAGIVCYTGAHIIMRAREIIEKVGRPLELDTDGIWCILPASFPENLVINTNDEKKKKLIISYPNAVLNSMVKEYFTNDQYHELVNPETMEYKIREENSIFFEVDGPYKAMVLPASKDEGKKLKKRYAVFNFDGSLAELKGFEIKRRGELQLIKNFQSSVFESFLKGDTLETCYAAVAQVANYWLDVLFSNGRNMPDSELFDLISENRSMSKKLEDYGGQKSTSISTAKRLAEFLGDQMVKDAGLACKYVISKKPNGAPVTERAIPLAIFQAEETVQKHYLRKWLKDSSLGDVDIRDILDWGYYIERLGGAIQKIITIPAAMQGVANPVPRVRHPDWLHKKMMEKNDNFKQRRINEIFSAAPKSIMNANTAGDSTSMEVGDLEDYGKTKSSFQKTVAVVNKRKRDDEYDEEQLNKTWREVLGNPPPFGVTSDERALWIAFQKKKWDFQALQRHSGCKQKSKKSKASSSVLRTGVMESFIQKAQRSLQTMPWQVIQVVETSTPGEFKLWALVASELHQVKLRVPKIYYVNLKIPKIADEGDLFKKCNRTLPRSRPVYNLYMYSVPEELYRKHEKDVFLDLSDPNVEGLYETQVSSMFRVLMQVGAVCKLQRGAAGTDSFDLEYLEMMSTSKDAYLPKDSLKHIYFYQHRHPTKKQQMFGLFITSLKKALIIVVDTVRTNLMPNMNNLYQAERIVKKEKYPDEQLLPPEGIQFEVRIETDLKAVYKLLNKALQTYKEEKRGPTLLAMQCTTSINNLIANIPSLNDFPQTQIHVQDMDDLYNNLEWQKIGSKALVRNYLNSERVIELMTEQCRYFLLPIGNMPSDPAIFGADLFFARHLKQHNHLLWCSPSDKPDLGGSQENDARLLAENQETASEVCNRPGWYSTMCIELDIDSLAINTLLQAHHVTDIEGTASVNAFDSAATASLDDLIGGNQMSYDETARCAEAFKILRGMATTWMRDISVYRNVYADFQVIHFYRWLRSPKSLLYDPALLRTLQNLMKKLFLQLVAELKRLGCTIVYANFNKIVICTKKRNVEDAVGNVEFVVTSIRNKELFHSLEITFRQCWEQLVWLDTANYAGIQGKLPESLQNDSIDSQNELEQEKNDEDEEDGPVVMMNWNIAEQLPEKAGCRNSFSSVIAGYIDAVHQRLSVDMNSSMVAPALSQPYNGLSAHEDVANYAKDLINGEISQTLFKITEKMNRILPQTPDGSFPALDYVKAVCHVLELDPAIKDAVMNLKSNLLRLIGVGEFSEKSVWKDPTVSYVIPQIICKACNHCRDLDLGRDPFRSENAWLCPLCNTSYDNSEIENLLLDIVSRKFLAYNLQDLQCKKCSQIKMENLNKTCSCASNFKCLISKDDLVKLYETFKILAGTFNMPTLRETMEQTLNLIY